MNCCCWSSRMNSTNCCCWSSTTNSRSCSNSNWNWIPDHRPGHAVRRTNCAFSHRDFRRGAPWSDHRQTSVQEIGQSDFCHHLRLRGQSGKQSPATYCSQVPTVFSSLSPWSCLAVSRTAASGRTRQQPDYSKSDFAACPYGIWAKIKVRLHADIGQTISDQNTNSDRILYRACESVLGRKRPLRLVHAINKVLPF